MSRSLYASHTLIALCCAATAAAQDPTPDTPPAETQKQDDGDRIIVTATRSEKSPFDVPFTTNVIDAQDVYRRSYRTLPQVLRDTPGIMVQETAHGHGSPYIRGFTSFRTLLLVDGVRLNHSAFRPGPNQYFNTLDPLSLDRVEVVKGPSSVLYGSDAVGGTISTFTRDPYTYSNEAGFASGGRTMVRFSDAENSLIGRGEFSLGHTAEDGSRTGALIGGTIKKFGDLESGGLTGLQPETGYDEEDYDIKLEHWFDDDTRLRFLHQRVFQNDVPRTHRTIFASGWRGTSIGSDQRREFDQDRTLTYLQFEKKNIGGAVEEISANLSWHQQEEVRYRIRGDGRQEFQGFRVGTLGASTQLTSLSDYGTWTYGVEFYHDDVSSYNRRVFPTFSESIQGPIGDDSTYDMLGVYLQDEFEATEDLTFIAGARFNYVAADADRVADPVNSGNVISVDDDWTAFVGSLRFVYELQPDAVNVFGGVSQGFRAPNLSDLTRFDTARTDEFEIPSPNLDPEEYIQYEIGVKARGERFRGEVSYFYTDIRDQIRRFPTGATNADGDRQVTKANVGDGYAYGVELGGAFRATDDVEVFANGTYIEGEVDNFTTSTVQTNSDYLTRLMPLTFQLGAHWEPQESKGWAEAVWVHAEDADKLSFSDVNDTSRVPPGGTPGYDVLHLRGGYQIGERTQLAVLLENVTDVSYRVHGSGQNRPGRNFIISVETTF